MKKLCAICGTSLLVCLSFLAGTVAKQYVEPAGYESEFVNNEDKTGCMFVYYDGSEKEVVSLNYGK